MGFAEEWRHWHRERVDALTTPYGPLSALCARTVRASATTSELRNVEWSVPRGIHPRQADAAANETLHIDLRLWEGSSLQSRLSRQQEMLVACEGAYALEVLEDLIEDITFGGIEVYRPHHDWIIPARYRAWPTPRRLSVPVPCTDGRERLLPLVGEVEFELDRQSLRLAVSPQPRGEFHAIFSDETRRDRFPFRFLHVPAPDEHGDTVLDFNRAVLPLGAFADRFPSPLPPRGNHVPVEIRAGESQPFLIAGQTQMDLGMSAAAGYLAS